MRWARRRASWVALGAAYLLFVQAILGGLAIGASAAPAAFDPLSALCRTDDGTIPARQDLPAGHPHLPDCCTTGCAMFSGAPVPGFVAVLLVPHLAGRSEPALLPLAPVAAAPQRSPANPRAPPAQA
ncbi:hypothetical protein [Inquilinus limosus]|uniref:DUF2946 domain-containing protein n=1 Tax=Inquilinus limosus MP06 TaxID=1398085 RepID=A0A0A0D009_9PROT|nr:hypothetical protein [Inquilinus limosus]KGM31183.1 hypothetical protein P409_28680 [Inquilinus limosus MP06]